MNKSLFFLVGSVALAIAVASGVGCGSNPSNPFDDDGGDGGGGSDALDENQIITPPDNDGSTNQTLDVQPKNPVLTYPGMKTQQFQALSMGQPVSAGWLVDNPSIGMIDQGGLFTASEIACVVEGLLRRRFRDEAYEEAADHLMADELRACPTVRRFFTTPPA